MSARNYTSCPNCEKIAISDREDAINTVRETYGKIKPEDFVEAMNEASKEPKLECTLAEYYEFEFVGITEFKLRYSCVCDECGFEFETKHKCKISHGEIPF